MAKNVTIPRMMFGTILTYEAPSSNYGGENADGDNRNSLQKMPIDGVEYPFVSSNAYRNALRESMERLGGFEWGKNINRRRVLDDPNPQAQVAYSAIPDEDKYFDDLVFGYVIANSKELSKDGAAIKHGRDSLLFVNHFRAITPYLHAAASFHQSPKDTSKIVANSKESVLFHREIVNTSFQAPFGLDIHGFVGKPKVLTALLSSIGDPGMVSGNQARTLFDFSPRSIVVRLCNAGCGQYKAYGFDKDGNFTDLSRINESDLDAKEWWLGGEVVRDMNEKRRKELESLGAKLYLNPQRMLADIAKELCKGL
jgi:CRISPR-associated protein Cst2